MQNTTDTFLSNQTWADSIFEQASIILKMDSHWVSYAQDIYEQYMTTPQSSGKNRKAIIAATIYIGAPQSLEPTNPPTYAVLSALFEVAEETIRKRIKELRVYYRKYWRMKDF